MRAAAAYFGIVFAVGFVLAFATGNPPALQMAAWATPAGALGLAGQGLFALLPWWQGQRTLRG